MAVQIESLAEAEVEVLCLLIPIDLEAEVMTFLFTGFVVVTFAFPETIDFSADCGGACSLATTAALDADA